MMKSNDNSIFTCTYMYKSVYFFTSHHYVTKYPNPVYFLSLFLLFVSLSFLFRWLQINQFQSKLNVKAFRPLQVGEHPGVLRCSHTGMT